MTNVYEIVLSLTIKIIVLIGFIYITSFWFRKKKNIYPKIVFYILGLFFVVLNGGQVISTFLQILFPDKYGLTSRDVSSSLGLGGLIAFALYFWVGMKNFKKNDSE